MRIGIIGGGVGGLAVAWNLHEQAIKDKQQPPDVVIFEKNGHYGGNAETRHFDFGNGPGYYDEPLKRWTDMGVNDFNTAAYGNIVKVMEQIGYTKAAGCYRNLENTTTYYDTKGHAFTDNTYKPDPKKPPVQDPWWGTAMPTELAKSAASFMDIAGKDGENPKFHDYTLQQYIDEQSKVHGWDKDLGPLVVYPRVNGMYFVSGATGPRTMPFAAVMHYYKIQEGAGGVPADRNYFVGGASTWIDALTNYMKNNMPEIEWHTGWDADIRQDDNDGGWTVMNAAGKSGERINVDLLVLATPADAALKAVKTGLPAEAANIMAQIDYEIAVSVAHTDSRLMPVNRNAWSTYNIVIHEPGSVALKPYVINYVANRHQNDAENPEFDKFGLPEFFLSINPHIPVSEDKVLKDVNGDRAMANLSHFTFDFACMQAQADIVAQQGVGNVYYASGWTHGSGLHTECWTQGSDIAEMILKHVGADQAVLSAPAKRADLITSRLAKAASNEPC